MLDGGNGRMKVDFRGIIRVTSYDRSDVRSTELAAARLRLHLLT